eukprot:12878564-Alexandrium_andersonii.AAC.1
MPSGRPRLGFGTGRAARLKLGPPPSLLRKTGLRAAQPSGTPSWLLAFPTPVSYTHLRAHETSAHL